MKRTRLIFLVAVETALAVSCCHRAGAASKDAILAQAAKACRTNEMNWFSALFRVPERSRSSFCRLSPHNPFADEASSG